MAKSEFSAEAATPARPPRPAPRPREAGLSGEGQPGPSPAQAGERGAGLDDDALLELRGETFAEAPYLEEGEPEELSPEELSPEELALELERAASESETRRPPGVSGGRSAEPRPRPRAARLPVARLEMPSSPRLELTPSPVPRVSLAPATGDVDISLVPGPGASHRMPTLAAQHVLGRREPRRRAPAITLPPPRASAGAPPLGAELAKDVRSSKREIVLGLTIGLGVSMLLASLGQAYLLGDPTEIAGNDAARAPAVESVTLSARAEPAPGVEQAAVVEAAVVGAAGVGAAGVEAADGRRTALAPRAPAEPVSSEEPGGDELAVQPVAGRASGSASAKRPPSRAVRRSAIVRPANPRGDAPHPLAPLQAPLAAGKSFEHVPASSPSLSPAESAGLGLDLQL